jgi:MFS family permease
VTGWFVRLLLVTVLAQAAICALRPMVSYQAIVLGADPAALGVIVASFAATPLLVVVPIGRWSDRWGERRFIVLGAAVIAAGATGLPWAGALGWLLVCNAVLGIGHVATVVGIQTLIARGGRPERRDRRFAMFTVANSLSLLLGPAVAGLLVGDVSAVAGDAAEHLDLVFWLAAGAGVAGAAVGVSLLLAPGTLARRPPARPAVVPTSSRRALVEVLRVPSMARAMFASLTVLSGVDILTAYLPAYAEANGISVRMVGFLLAVQGLSALVSRLAMLPLVALLSRRWVLVVSMGTAAAALAMLPFTTALPVLFGIMVAAGFGLGLGQPITLAWVAARAPRDVRGTALGIRLSGNRLGQTVLPAAVGALAGALGLAALFLSPAALLALGSALVVRARFDGEPPQGTGPTGSGPHGTDPTGVG